MSNPLVVGIYIYISIYVMYCIASDDVSCITAYMSSSLLLWTLPTFYSIGLLLLLLTEGGTFVIYVRVVFGSI